MRRINSKLSALVIGISSILLTACGQSGPSVTGATLKTYQQNADQYGQLSVRLNTSKLSLPAVSFPIVVPQVSGSAIGNVGLQPGAQAGQSSLVIDLDLTAALRLPATTAAALPNGMAVPVAGLSQAVVIPLGNTGSKAYLSLDLVTKKAFVGAALVIPQFDLGRLSEVFLPFAFNDASGMAGVFTGTSTNQSGLAVFADVSALLNSAPLLQTNGHSAGDVQGTENMLYKLNARATRLTVR